MTPEQTEYYARILSHSQLFHGIEEKALTTMIEKGVIKTFPDSGVLVEENNRVEGLHIILEGSANVKKGSTSLTLLGRGAFFGEISLFGASFGATASIIAHEKMSVLVISKAVLDAWGIQFPVAEKQFLRKMCTELSRRLYSANERNQ